MTVDSTSTFTGLDGEGVPLWTVQDLSRYLQIPVGTIYQWRHRGEGPPALRLGNHLRWEPSVVHRWASSQR
jgi:excisionase family DNA binding protein